MKHLNNHSIVFEVFPFFGGGGGWCGWWFEYFWESCQQPFHFLQYSVILVRGSFLCQLNLTNF